VNSARGQITARETGKGLPSLLVVAFDVDDPDAPLPDVTHAGDDLWSKLPGRRLGSAVTDQAGAFELRYDLEHRGGADDPRANLLLVVVAPEDRQDACPALLHLSCGIRKGAAPTEHFVIRVSEQRLRDTGVIREGATDPPVPRSGVDGIIGKLRGVDRQRQDERVKDTTFSQHFRARREAERDKLGEKDRVRVPPRSFRYAVAVRAGAGALPEGAAVFWDSRERALMFQPDAGAAPLALAFGGVRAVEPTGPASTTGLTVDIDRGRFTLDLVAVPHALGTTEPKVSELYRWYSRFLRQARPGA
jgi:hypothetical protein